MQHTYDEYIHRTHIPRTHTCMPHISLIYTHTYTPHTQHHMHTSHTHTCIPHTPHIYTHIHTTYTPDIYTHIHTTYTTYITHTYFIPRIHRRCPWCNGYRPGKCTRRHEFKSWTRLVAFHIALIPLGKV